MARSSSSSQRVWKGLKSFLRTNRLSLAAGLVLTGLAVTGLVLSTDDHADRHSHALQKLSKALPLFQAFRADPTQPAPLLWKRRLGVKPATQIWRRLGRGIWWQGWSVDGEAYLVLPTNLLTAEERARAIAHSLDGLEVLSADGLNQQFLRQQLDSTDSSGVDTSPLLSSCLRRLAREPSVIWGPEALARFSGATAPLLQSAGYGCLSLRVRNGHLQWHGWVGSRNLAGAPSSLKPDREGFSDDDLWSGKGEQQRTENAFDLLMMEGAQLGVLLSALESREIIRRPLERNYALSGVQRTKLLQTPFRLRLVARPQGAFKAGLQLQLWPQADRQSIDSSLQALTDRLNQQGLVQEGSRNVIWRDSDPLDQTVLGGWRWLQPQSARPTISLGLGMEPSPVPLPSLSDQAARPGILLDLRARPADLTTRGLLDGKWPRVVKQAPTLSLRLRRLSSDRDASEWSELSGQLELPVAEDSTSTDAPSS